MDKLKLFDRDVQIIEYMQRHGGFCDSVDLAIYFKVSTRTIRSDLKRLKQYHLIKSRRGNGGGYFLIEENWRK